MKLSYKILQHFPNNGEILWMNGLSWYKSRPCNMSLLLKSNKCNLPNQRTAIRLLFTDELLGVSVFRKKQSAVEKEFSHLKLHPADFEKSVMRRVPPNTTSPTNNEGKHINTL